jgi:hypothetical protein
MDGLMKEWHVRVVVVRNELHASLVERVIGTIKLKLFRYFEHKQSHKWINIIDDVVNSYNHTYHRTLKAAPNDVTKENQDDFFVKLYYKKGIDLAQNREKTKEKKKVKNIKQLQKKQMFKFKIGDHVRLAKLRGAFLKKTDQPWTRELFIIKSRQRKSGIPLYTLEDLMHKDIIGTFYEAELSKVKYDPTKGFKIEKILKKRTRKGKKEYFVKWLGYPDSASEWINQNQLTNI